MEALIAKARFHFHKRMFETNTLTLTKTGVVSNADTSSKGSKAISKKIVDILIGERGHKINITEKISGQTLGKQFEHLTMEFLQETFPNLQNLYPGKCSLFEGGEICREFLDIVPFYKENKEVQKAVNYLENHFNKKEKSLMKPKKPEQAPRL